MERDLERELRSHIDLQIEEYTAAGMPSDEARRLALREFGGVTRFQDDVRDMWVARARGDRRAAGAGGLPVRVGGQLAPR